MLRALRPACGLDGIQKGEAMRHRRVAYLAISMASAVVVWTLTPGSAAADHAGDLIASRDPFGQLRTFTTSGSFDFENPFFQDLGTNGRACVTCHQPDQGWTISPDAVRRRFSD